MSEGARLECVLEVKECGCMVTPDGTIYCQKHKEERKSVRGEE